MNILEKDINNQKIVSLKAVSDYIDLNYGNKAYIGDFKPIIVSYNINTLNHSFCLNKLKYDGKNSIYFISFLDSLNLDISINSIVKNIRYDYLVSNSFIYKNIDYKFNIYPLNLDIISKDFKIYFSITYAFLDDKIDNNLETDTKNKYKKYIDKDFDENFNDAIKYIHIDKNKEFM